MALYHSAESPGDWRSFLKRNDISKLSLTEQKKKYLQETLQFEDFMSQQMISRQLALNDLSNTSRVAGNKPNKVINAVFNATPVLQSLTANITFIDVVFLNEVLVDDDGGSSIPAISVTNGKQGGGTTTPIVYTYVNNNSPTKLVRFQHSHDSFPNNNGNIAAHVIAADTSFAGDITTTTLTGATGGATAAGVTFTAAQGTGGTGFQNITADVTVAGGGTTLDVITFKTSASAATYSPGQTFTATAAQIGAGGTGEVTVTIDSALLTGDILTMVSSSITENGANIYTAANPPNVALNLSYTSTSTKTAIAS